jgi:hypothetical protein
MPWKYGGEANTDGSKKVDICSGQGIVQAGSRHGRRLVVHQRSARMPSEFRYVKFVSQALPCIQVFFQEGSSIIDATRVVDAACVTLKIVDEKRHPDEADIALFLTSDSLASDSRNHSAPVLEVLAVPCESLAIIVMPLLQSCYDPDIKTVGEATELIRQMIEVSPISPLDHTHTLELTWCRDLSLCTTTLWPICKRAVVTESNVLMKKQKPQCLGHHV